MASFPGYPLGREFPETFPKMWSFDSSHVLVRLEYVEAEQAALVANANNTWCQRYVLLPGPESKTHMLQSITCP